MKRRDLIRILKSAGYTLDRDDGRHTILEMEGRCPGQDPRPREINENTAKSILKAAGLQ